METTSIANMAKCLILLSRGGGDQMTESMTMSTQSPSRVFECKTCNRQFPSFQALGGHRASHKKPRLLDDSSDHHLNNNNNNNNQVLQISQMKPKIHECSICGLEFAIGQALGGHMRRHRATITMDKAATTATAGLSSSSSSLSHPTPPPPPPPQQQVPVLKRSNSRRVLCLDLNLAPPEISSDFEFSTASGIAAGKITPPPMIHCFI
ncbi:zinc finger protein [Macleaya cordata]|uniref:Zinc finger protein n=1 Tax=Macleaya cordata TaxID=56857 RepID=A0A200PZ96_MACCD|nr:zinc finger protein [Macleaya cordata]